MKELDKKILKRLVEVYGLDDVNLALMLNEALQSYALQRLFDVNGYVHIDKLGEQEEPLQPKAVEFLRTLPIFWDRILEDGVQKYMSAQVDKEMPPSKAELRKYKEGSGYVKAKKEYNDYFGNYKTIEDVKNPELRKLIDYYFSFEVYGGPSGKTTGSRSAENLGRWLADKGNDPELYDEPEYAIMILTDANERILYVVSHEDLYQVGGTATRSSVISWSYKDPDNLQGKVLQKSWKTDPYIDRIYLIAPARGFKEPIETANKGIKLAKYVKNSMDGVIKEIDDIVERITENENERKIAKKSGDADEVQRLSEEIAKIKKEELERKVNEYTELFNKYRTEFAEYYRKLTPASNPKQLSAFKLLKDFRLDAKANSILTPSELIKYKTDITTTAYDEEYAENLENIKRLKQKKAKFSLLDEYLIVKKLKNIPYRNLNDLNGILKDSPRVMGIDKREIREWIVDKSNAFNDLYSYIESKEDISYLDENEILNYINNIEDIKDRYLTDYNNYARLWNSEDDDVLSTSGRLYRALHAKTRGKDKLYWSESDEKELTQALNKKEAEEKKTEKIESKKRTYGFRTKESGFDMGKTQSDILKLKQNTTDAKMFLNSIRQITNDIPTFKNKDFKDKSDVNELKYALNVLEDMGDTISNYVAYNSKRPDKEHPNDLIILDRFKGFAGEMKDILLNYYTELLYINPKYTGSEVSRCKLFDLAENYKNKFNERESDFNITIDVKPSPELVASVKKARMMMDNTEE